MAKSKLISRIGALALAAALACTSLISASAATIDKATIDMDAKAPLVVKTITYYISVPNYGIALPEIENLNESAWIVDRLLVRNMPRVDAVTIAQVLRDVLKNEVKQNSNEIQSL